MGKLADAVSRRRTFAIISHPDAGKTTLTEKLLLFGGAIQLAGTVKARGARRRARSDWMQVEQERGISVTASVMTYEYEGLTFNLLDTPGHEDFSEDTYRTLTAVDSAVMVLDVAKGIETQTRKLFEVCRTRDVPIVTFVNKLDREGKDPFELLDEIEQTLQLEVSPASWPIGMGQRFQGVYDIHRDTLVLLDRQDKDRLTEGLVCEGLDDPAIEANVGADAASKLREEVAMARELCPPFDLASYLSGDLTPVFFGSALNNFGVREVLGALAEIAPPPRPQPTVERRLDPTEETVAGFVFKIQANMDPRHRDRIAFVRLCSGHFERGMKLSLVRTGATINVHNPVMFVARDRELAEEAWPGDIIGIPNRGTLRIGDALTQGEELHFTGIPSFAPELLRKVRPVDPMRAKHLGKALLQLAEEGAAKVFKRDLGGEWVVGVVGALQFDVIAARIRTEYNIAVIFESSGLETARWLETDDPKHLQLLARQNRPSMAEDHGGIPVFLARNLWQLDLTVREHPEVRFLDQVPAGF
jgi:peptide chain release factor 3